MGLWFFREALPSVPRIHSRHLTRVEESGTYCSDWKEMPYGALGES